MWKEGKEGSPPLAWSLLFKGECNNNREGRVPTVIFHLLSIRKCSCATHREGNSLPQPRFWQLLVRSCNFNKKEEEEEEEKEKEVRKQKKENEEK
jgi:hypothetical protein